MNPARAAVFLLLAGLAVRVWAQSGLELIEASLARHPEPPHVYEEDTLVLSDRQGNHTVRTLRHYARNEGSVRRSLWVIETPVELRGIEVGVVRDLEGTRRRGTDAASRVFGSDFSLADLETEQPARFRYARADDVELDRIAHLVVRALPRDEAVALATGYAERRIYLRKDNLYISRIDYQDRHGRLARRETFRDPRPDDTGAWRANMILMENLRDNRRSLLKVDQRVHAAEYVPAEVFRGLP